MVWVERPAFEFSLRVSHFHSLLCAIALATTSCVVEQAPDEDGDGGSVSRGGSSNGGSSATGGGSSESGGRGGSGTGPESSGGNSADPEGGATSGPEGGAGGARPHPIPEAGTASVGDDPCQGVSRQGRCLDDHSYELCAVATGNAEPTVVERGCRAVERCVDSAMGAQCELLPSSCVPGGSECTGGTSARVCNDQGEWEEASCDGSECLQTSLGASCAPTFATRVYQGNLTYEAFLPEQDLSDWSGQSQWLAAEGVLALSLHGEDLVDAALVDDKGNFSVRVPSTLGATDRVAFFLLHPDGTGATAEYAVFDPDVPTGTVDVPPASLSGQFWQFAIDPADYPNGTPIRITEADGSGAVHLYNYIGLARSFTQAVYGAAPRSVLAHFHLNTEFSCGACFLPLAVNFNALSFDSQLFFSATANDRAYWADPVTVHEIGHYTMWAFGKLPGEGGPHCLGVPALPGIAWSEGWATGFASIALDSPIYYDKQQGTMFWIDLEQRRYSARRSWTRPDPQYGLIQLMDENDVAAMLWQLAADNRVGAELVLGSLTHPRVTRAPFARGYTRHVWEIDDECLPDQLSDTGESAPMFADFLDALRCGGAPAAAIDDVTEPDTSYPYPSNAPICK